MNAEASAPISACAPWAGITDSVGTPTHSATASRKSA